MLIYLLAFFFATATADDDYAISIDTTATLAGPLTTTFTPPASCFTATTELGYGAAASLVEGCKGLYGNECCPDGWKFDNYFSPGVCPQGYTALTLPTTKQRVETTNMCCPEGFTAIGQAFCSKAFNPNSYEYSTITYTDSTISVETSVSGITASPIMIRFKAADSTAVPIPTESFKLPKPNSLDTREKVGIGIGVPAAVILVCGIGFYIFRRHRRSRASKKLEVPLSEIRLSMPPDPDLERDRVSDQERAEQAEQARQREMERERDRLRERLEEDRRHEREQANELDPPPAYSK